MFKNIVQKYCSKIMLKNNVKNNVQKLNDKPA